MFSMEDRLLAVRASVAGRVIVHVDMDAFYAQCEMRRLDLDPEMPAAVQQWGSLIAVNYPARRAGVTRHVRATEAKRLCPNIRLVHVDLLDDKGNLRDPASATQANSKVSLSRYRSASHELFAVLVRLCGEKSCEKASVDEAYLDVTHICEEILETGRLPPQFAPSRLAAPRRLWCAEGWLRRPCASEACAPCHARTVLTAAGYGSLFPEAAPTSCSCPDGSLFFVPPSPALRWQLRQQTAAPDRIGAAAAGDGIVSSADAVRAVSAGGAAVPEAQAPCGGCDAASDNNLRPTQPVIADAPKRCCFLKTVVAQKPELPATAAECLLAVLLHVSAARWHILGPSGGNAALPEAQATVACGADTLDVSILASPLGIRLAAGAVVAACIRRVVYEELALTCSVGIAHNKTLAKLGSTKNKPDAQTLVLAAVVPGIMQRLPLQKIRFLGGKLGGALAEAVLSARASSEAATKAGRTDGDTAARSSCSGAAAPNKDDEPFGDSDDEDSRGSDNESLAAGADGTDGKEPQQSRPFPLPPSAPHAAGPAPTAGEAQRLGFRLLCEICGSEDRAAGLYRLLHGIDDADIVPRSKPKQLGAGKSFAASSCATFQDACSWLRMFSAEIEHRITEDTALFRRSPTTISLHYFREPEAGAGSGTSRLGGRSHSKSAQLLHGAGVLPQAMCLLHAACVDEGVVGLHRSVTTEPAALLKEDAASGGEAAGAPVAAAAWLGPMFPCTHLTLSVGGFVDAGVGAAGSARAMRAFLASGAAAAAATATAAPGTAAVAGLAVDTLPPVASATGREQPDSESGTTAATKRRRDAVSASAGGATVAALFRRQAEAAVSAPGAGNTASLTLPVPAAGAAPTHASLCRPAAKPRKVVSKQAKLASLISSLKQAPSAATNCGEFEKTGVPAAPLASGGPAASASGAAISLRAPPEVVDLITSSDSD